MDRPPIVYAWIFARGGSKGLPGKNIRLLYGKPLIAYAIATARCSRYIDDVFVSTDSPEIADIALKYGAVVPFLRPAELSTDTADERMAWRHAVKWLRSQKKYAPMDIMVSLPATSPLRTVDEVDRAIELFQKRESDTVIAVSQSSHHPAFDMVYLDENNYANTILSQYENWLPNRQSYRPAYNITGSVYVTSPEFVMQCDSYLKGKVQAVIVPEEHSINIDTLQDFDQAGILLKKRLIRKNFS